MTEACAVCGEPLNSGPAEINFCEAHRDEWLMSLERHEALASADYLRLFIGEPVANFRIRVDEHIEATLDALRRFVERQWDEL